MTDIVIKAENLSKHDTTGHQAADGRYVAPARCAGAERAPSTPWQTAPMSTQRRKVSHIRHLLFAIRYSTNLMRGKPLILGNELEEVWAMSDLWTVAR